MESMPILIGKVKSTPVDAACERKTPLIQIEACPPKHLQTTSDVELIARAVVVLKSVYVLLALRTMKRRVLPEFKSIDTLSSPIIHIRSACPELAVNIIFNIIVIPFVPILKTRDDCVISLLVLLKVMRRLVVSKVGKVFVALVKSLVGVKESILTYGADGRLEICILYKFIKLPKEIG